MNFSWAMFFLSFVRLVCIDYWSGYVSTNIVSFIINVSTRFAYELLIYQFISTFCIGHFWLWPRKFIEKKNILMLAMLASQVIWLKKMSFHWNWIRVCWNFLRNLTAWENHQMSHWKCAFTNGCCFLDILLAIALNYIQKFCIFNVIHSRSLTT